MLTSKSPNPNIQIPNNFKYQNSKLIGLYFFFPFGYLNFEHWKLFGIWCLDFGIVRQRDRHIK